MTRDRGLKSSNAKEEIIHAEDLRPETKYRIVISVKNTEEDRFKPVTFNLRIEIQENLKSYKGSKGGKEILPQSIGEIARYKLKNEGLKESDFLMTSMKTLEYFDSAKLTPFV